MSPVNCQNKHFSNKKDVDFLATLLAILGALEKENDLTESSHHGWTKYTKQYL